MALTRRFYNAIARDLADAKPPKTEEALVAVWAHCVTITASHFALDNAMFDTARFHAACGLTAADRQR